MFAFLKWCLGEDLSLNFLLQGSESRSRAGTPNVISRSGSSWRKQDQPLGSNSASRPGLKTIAIVEAKTEQFREVAQELHQAVYGVQNSELERLPILRKEPGVSSPRSAKVIKMDPFISNE